MSVPDPKPAARIVATKEEWDEIVRLKDGVCRGCRKRGQSLHHLVPVGRTQEGDDVADNLIPLCGHGTAGCHGVITSHNRDGESGLTYHEVAHAIRARLTPAELAYVLRKKGRDWLDEHYPSGLLSEGEELGSGAGAYEPALQAPPPSESSPLCARCRRQLSPGKSGEQKKPRPRKQKTISVPADEQENGLDAFDSLLEACGEELVRVRGGNRRSAYYELMDCMQFFLTTPKEAA